MAADVVCLVCHGSGDVGIGSSGGEEDPEIPDTRTGSKTHDWQADEGKNGVEDDDWPTNVVLISDPGGAEHNDTSKDVWGSHEALSGANAEAHTTRQDDGEEIGDSIRDRSCAAKG